MRRPRSRTTLAAAGLATALAAALLGPVGPARADVGVTQQAVLVGEKPVSGQYTQGFNDYGPDGGVVCPPRAGQCFPNGRPVARGKVHTKLSVYRIKDGIKKYDYYLLDVDVAVDGHVGRYRKGDVRVGVTSRGPKLVDYSDTRSIKADEGDCHSVDLGFQTPWPVITASADLGSVTWCDDDASLQRTRTGRTSSWLLRGIGRTDHFAVDRAVKVRAGKRPRFRVTVTVPTDTCTKAKSGKCLEYDGDTDTASYRVGSRG